MHFIRIIRAATKSTTRTKKLTNKPSKALPKTAPKRDLTKNTSKGIKPYKNSVKTRNKQVNKRFKIQPNTTYPLQDMSTNTLQDLLEQGYNMVTFVAHPNACNYCKGINGKTKSLAQHLQSLQFDAPLFEMSHVNSMSELKIWDKTGELPDVFVNYEGDTHE